jgi:phosphate transport system permease protein
MSLGMSRFKLKMLYNQLIESSIANAIVQTILMVDIGVFFRIPVGIMTGTFVAEFSKTNKITNF